MMSQKDYYTVLGIGKDASEKKIKAAYRKLAIQHHPDRNRDNPVSAEKMKDLNEAYAVLSNPIRRSEYDALRQQYGSSAHDRFRKSYSENDIFRGSDVHQIFEELARSMGLRGFDEMFKEFYGSGYRTFEFKKADVRGGGFFFFGTIGASDIPKMSGTLGKLARFFLESFGMGQLPGKGRNTVDDIVIDPEMAATGGPYAYHVKKRSKKLVVKIPPGVRDGQRIRLSGMGEEARSGGRPGDLFLKVRISKPLLQKLKDLISK